MLNETFEKLLSAFQQVNEGKQVNLGEILRFYFEFMEEVKTALIAGNQDERKEVMKKLGEMYAQILSEAKKVSDKTGMSEEQLSSFSSNPTNFSPEMWAALQEARKKMSDSSKELTDILNPTRDKIPLPSTDAKGGKGKKPKAARRDKWMKS